MYLEHFGLDRFPFTIAPDPGFLFPSSGHQEAMVHLHYALTGHGGLICLTGEVGTGKTTLCRAFLEQLNEQTLTAYLFNPQLSPVELMQSLCIELGVPFESEDSLQTLYGRLNEALLKAYAAGKKVICIVDEAQSMPTPLLEQIRLLTNLETSQDKLLTLILVGQPELNDLLARHDLRQLNQRITARYHLRHLDLLETRAYLKHRLARTGCHTALFDSASAAAIQRASGGVPRLINSIADRALLGAYASGMDSVVESVALQAASEVLGQSFPAQALGASSSHLSDQSAGAHPQVAERSFVDWLPSLMMVFVIAVGVWLFWPMIEPRLSGDRSASSDTLAVAGNQGVESSENIEPDSTSASGSRSSDAGLPEQDPAVEVLAPALGLNARRCEELIAGWKCMRVSWSLEQLRPLQNQVAVIKPDGQWVRLANYSGSSIDSSGSSRPLVIWQPPAGYDGLLKPGDRHPVIAWVRQVLGVDSQSWQVIGPTGSKASSMPEDFYDPHLGNKVAEFQVRNGLAADRLIGPQTLLYLQRLAEQSKADSEPVDAKGAG